MTRASLLFRLLGATALFAGCDIPSATFDNSTAAGGTGGSTTTTSTSTTTPMHTTSSTGGTGAGGTGGSTTTTTTSTGGSTTTTTTTTSAGGGPTVPCGYPAIEYECEPGQVCCFEKTDPDGGGPLEAHDLCKSPGTCGSPAKYAEIKCNENADCTGADICCAYYAADPDGVLRIQSTFCKDSCDAGQNEIETCTGDDPSCPGDDFCTPFYVPDYFSYNFCIGL